MKFIRFVHKLFYPNCQCMVCELPSCQLCDEYRTLLNEERMERNKLFQFIQSMNRVPVESLGERVQIHIPNKMTWDQQRKRLEKDDRLKSIQEKLQREENIASEKLNISELEKKLGLEDAIK